MHVEHTMVSTTIITVPGAEYDSFKRKVFWLKFLGWVGFIVSFVGGLGYMFYHADNLALGLIVFLLTLILAFLSATGPDIFTDRLSLQLALAHGWNGTYPFQLKPEYQSFVHE